MWRKLCLPGLKHSVGVVKGSPSGLGAHQKLKNKGGEVSLGRGGM
jgi:hypothetical protein